MNFRFSFYAVCVGADKTASVDVYSGPICSDRIVDIETERATLLDVLERNLGRPGPPRSLETSPTTSCTANEAFHSPRLSDLGGTTGAGWAGTGWDGGLGGCWAWAVAANNSIHKRLRGKTYLLLEDFS